MTKRSLYQRRWRKRLKSELIRQLGGKCRDCRRKTGLQFAHVRPTGLSGPGRGTNERLLDVRRNLDCYTLLCPVCHVRFDNSETPF
jgi:formate-dependent nitrite reductase cytochrome c552 subunit